MGRRAGKNKITKYRRHSFFNIGTLLFGTIFIYMIISLFMYLTETHVTAYEVMKGAITGNYRYHALALRTEEIVTATQSGSVRYFEREGSRTPAGNAVCAVNESGSKETAAITDFSLEAEDAKRIQDIISNFTINYSGSAFQTAYDLKASVEGRIAEAIEENSSDYVSVHNQCFAPESGFVLYSIDGFEDVTEDQLTQDMFSQSGYNPDNLRSRAKVKAGEPLFKLVTKEAWAVYFPVDEKLLTELADMEKIRFRFLKDNETFTAPFSVIQNGDEVFGKISLNSSLVRYVDDRFLEIELLLNKKEGLKIPSSAIVERTFYKIPEEYVIKNEDTDQEVVLKVEHFGEDGASSVKYVTANVYQYQEGYYLIDRNVLSEGDYIQLEDSAKRMQVQEKDLVTLHGVYNINKGYAVFREITVIDENEEYCIVESNNTYSLSAYDFIVLDAAQVTEDQIVY
ncbi:HlyD family efflux transporter periplasmic adaptor subunit [Parablautia sp. Marseille-Q6255]|uniref:HlyD family efflux transporter periplasmic adaptor subunit n=1 Tax=Parablautia sp. Marseille-Q6255 TaxID=3039593 RepID=UPI0024BD0577|nr:HlyD family efflux transporter periplasmic adaptor subunit [Parablautia sp. Marseille-Q6255]